MSVFGATPFEALYYAPGNPFFPVLPTPGTPVGFRALAIPPEIGGRIRKRTARHGGVRVIKGAARGPYSDWYLNQWWITPSPLAFGNIVSEKTLSITVLSTFFDGQHTLNDVDISALGAGISVTLPSPNTFDTLESKSFDMVASTAGAASFEDDVVFEFDNFFVTIEGSGRRVSLFPYVPQSGASEQLSWVTDIMKARDGTEQRHSLRLTPRQTIDYTYLLEDGTDASRLRNILTTIQPLLLGVPIWWEAQEVTAASLVGGTTIAVNTSFVDHRDGATILIFRPDGVAFDSEIASFTSSEITTSSGHALAIPLGSLVMPVRVAYIQGNPRYRDKPDGALSTSIRFVTTDNVDLEEGSPQVDFPTHPTDGLTILSDPNFMPGKTVQGSVEMEFQRIDNQIGVPQQFLQENIGDPMSTKGVEFHGSIEEIRKWRAWLHYVRGSWRTFYLPTFRRDFTPTQNVKLSDSSFIAEDVGLAAFIGTGQAPLRDLMLELPDGRQFFARITNVVDNGDGTETVSISPFWGTQSPDVDIVPADAKISFLHLVRLEGDVATFVHEYVGTAALRFNTRGVQD